MGNQQSSTVLERCLISAVNGNADMTAFPSSPLYQLEDVRPYNKDVAVHPIAVTYPETTSQVAAIVGCANSIEGSTVQARSGGHSYANFALGGGDSSTIVIDLKHFQLLSIDLTTWEATIGAGTNLGDVTSKLSIAGNRAMAHGTSPDIGIGGHATMGGLGPTSRMWGSAMDHVIEYEVVLANSTVVKASATQHPEVFYAMKGAGASFGIATFFKVETHPTPGEMVEYSYTFSGRPYAKHSDRFKAWQSLISNPTLSRKFASNVMISELGMVISGTYFGSKSEFEALNLTSVFPDHSKSDVIVFDDFLGLVGHWAESVSLYLGGIQSSFYSKNLAFNTVDLIPEVTIDAFFKYLDKVNKGTLAWAAIFDLQGGATNDIPATATAYSHRDALFYFQTYGIGPFGMNPTIRAFITGMNNVLTSGFPGKNFGSYPGYVDLELKDAQQAYFGNNLPELERLKRDLDPKDLFHNPQSIRPATLA